MKVLLSWINDYVDISALGAKTIAKGLTDAGFEVEDIIDKAAGLDKVVVSRITEIKPHPNADKLVICQADYGFGKTQIVTHATNMKEGDNVPLALDGAHLPNGAEIKNGNLRGIPSNGMFCAGEELGITDDIYPGAEVDGLLILSKDFIPGTPIAKVLKMDEVVLDVNVLPNRADCNSIYGIAREISVIFSLPLKPLDLTYTTKSTRKVDVDVQDFSLCPRYEACVVENVKNGESPDYIKRRLTLLDHTPHSLFVDITNYVLLEVGQPMHAFDLSKVEGEKIVVRRANEGEKLVALDNKEYNLTANNLVIANAHKPMVIAGIMGGAESGTYPTTHDVLLESANFNFVNIRHSSYQLGLSSDSSVRYSKGVFVENTEIGLKRALNIIDSIGAGSISSVIVDCKKELPKQRVVTSSVNGICDRLGLKVDADVMVDILNRLNIKSSVKNGVITSLIPPERTDIERECDICEEVGRIYGLDKISVDSLGETDFSTVGELTIEQKNINRIKLAASLNGYYEMLNWQFGSPKLIAAAGLNLDDHIKILNPIGQDYSIVRRSLLPAMLQTVAQNINMGNKQLKLFELARVFIPKQLPITELPNEHNNLCLVTTDMGDFYKLKDDLNKIMASIGVPLTYKQSTNDILHPGICADVILYNRKIGVIGEVHPKILKNFDINQKVYAAEIDLSNAIVRLNDRHNGAAPEKLPHITRDLAIVLDSDISAGSIIEVALKADKQNIAGCKVFDVYTSDTLGEHKKSVAFTLSIRQGEKPLAEAEIAPIVEKVLNAEIKEFNAKLR